MREYCGNPALRGDSGNHCTTKAGAATRIEEPRKIAAECMLAHVAMGWATVMDCAFALPATVFVVFSA